MDVNITIIGAGVIGLAIAREISKNSTNIFLIEKNLKFGQESSSRNSEVVHSGIHYPYGSLKTRLCIQGKEMLYNYCDVNGISYRKCGKLIVSSSVAGQNTLIQILQRAQKNGVNDGRIIDKDEIHDIEPDIIADTAVYFPSSGIIDSHSLMKQFETDAINNESQLVYGSEVVSLKKLSNGYEVTLKEQGGSVYSFTSAKVINSAGLYADKIASMLELNIPENEIFYWKGEYFSLSNGKHKFVSGLIYPAPESNMVGLGIHTTVDLGGRVRLGPNALFMTDKKIDYSIDPEHAKDFFLSVKKYLPFLELNDLVPDMVGIRPKLQKPGDPIRDFMIREETNAGYPGFINLIGIESPGLTACMSIAKYVNQLINKPGNHDQSIGM